MTRLAQVVAMLPLVLLLLGSSQPARMLASAQSAHESSDVVSSGVDLSLERELSSAGLTGFASLIKQAGIMPELELRARFGSALTIFAPTNVALMRADPALLAFLKLPRNAALLRDVLLYHVVARPVSAFAWEGSYETLQGAPIALHVDELAFQVGGTSVKQYRALTLSLTPLSPAEERHSGKGADSAAASAQLSAGDAGSSTVVVHTVNALLLPPFVEDLLSLSAGDLSIVGGMGECGRQLAESSGFASASASSPSASPPPPVLPSPPPPTPSFPPTSPPPKSGAHARSFWQLFSSVALAVVVVVELF